MGGMMRECDILLVRHPETEANISGRLVGRGHSEFTAEGRRQLARVPSKIAAFGPSRVWTSPLEGPAGLLSEPPRERRSP